VSLILSRIAIFWNFKHVTEARLLLHGGHHREQYYSADKQVEFSVSFETRKRSRSHFKLNWFHNSKILNCSSPWIYVNSKMNLIIGNNK